MSKKFAEKAEKICGTLNNEMSKREEDKKVIAHVIKLMSANVNYQKEKAKKLVNEEFTESVAQKYHEICTAIYEFEYIKKTCMVKYTGVYTEPAAKLLEESYEKDKTIDEVAMKVAKEFQTRIKMFMDEKNLKSRLL